MQRKQEWDGEADQSQREVPVAPARSQMTHELSRRPKQKARKLVLPASSTDTGRATERRNSPSSWEDASARVLGSTADLPAPKARTPSEEARRTLGQGRRHATPASVPAMDRCLASEQVPFNDSTSSQEPSAQAPSAKEKCMEEPSAQRTSGEVPSAQIQLEQFAEDEGRKEETCVPSAQTPLAEAVRAGEACPLEARSPTPSEMLA